VVLEGQGHILDRELTTSIVTGCLSENVLCSKP